MRSDLIVVGAGPAGVAAALEAAELGLNVVLVDEATRTAAPPGIRTLFDHQVWSVSPGFRVDAIGPDGAMALHAERLVVATGAFEHQVPFLGWTLPGVAGLVDAAAALVTAGAAPGQRVVVAGRGALAAAAARLASAGMKIVAIADLGSQLDWMAGPTLVGQGAGWTITLAAQAVPVLFRHTVMQVQGEERVQRVALAPVDEAGSPLGEAQWFDVDAVCVGHGLTVGSEISRLLRAPHRFAPRLGGWVPVLDADGRTGIPGLYAAGDTAAVAGEAAAGLAGRLAGRAAALDAGRTAADPWELRQAHAAALRCADAAAGPMLLQPALVDRIAPDTLVCRCEGITRAGIEAAITDGARDVNQVKHFTRSGMGLCQGRRCAETVAELVARHVGSREAAGYWTMRPPLRPIRLDALLGRFDYADIPVPQPAPL